MADKRLTKTKGLLKWLTENGHTAEEAQQEWDKAVAINVGGLVGWLHKEGYDWRYLQTYQINGLFGLAERTLSQRKATEEERKKKEEEELRRKQEKEYKRNHYDEYILNKIDSGENLDESELRNLRWEFDEVEIQYGENRRWSRSVRSILEIGGRYFALDWDEGLTEMQENEFYNQPIEVEKKEYPKTITVTEWNEIKKD
jgi:hypothetical protein